MLIHEIVQFTDQSERLCISFKMIKVLTHLFLQDLIYALSTKQQRRQVSPEPIPNHRLTKMSKRRVPNIMYQARAL